MPLRLRPVGGAGVGHCDGAVDLVEGFYGAGYREQLQRPLPRGLSEFAAALVVGEQGYAGLRELRRAARRNDQGNPHAYGVKWASPPEAEEILLEAAVDEKDAGWVPLAIYPATASGCQVVQRIWGPNPVMYSLKFRATPVRSSPWPGDAAR